MPPDYFAEGKAHIKTVATEMVRTKKIMSFNEITFLIGCLLQNP